MNQPAEKMGLFAQIKSYNKTFWLANLMEMIERWAYYGVRLVLALYIVGATAQGGLEFNHIQKGNIYLWWAIIASFLPMFTGGFADRYGYKKTIAIAVAMKIVGYLLMATQKEYIPFFIGCMILAAGTGLFKPGVQGLLAHNVTSKTASVGWGVFYELVNFGAFIAGLMATPLRDSYGWGAVFYFNTALVALNFLPLLLFKEPDVPRPENKGGLGATLSEMFDILVVSLRDIIQPRLFTFILISSGFWFAFHQLFDLLPNFLDDWVHASTLPVIPLPTIVTPAITLPFATIPATTIMAPYSFLTATGAVAPEKVLNLNSGFILLAMVPIAFLASKFRALTAINMGIMASIVGIIVAGLTQNGWYAIAGILIFTLGEMLSSPRTNDYLASIAPEDKKGLYLGYANVPSGIGWAIGSIFAGNVYEHHGDKVNFARHWLETQGGMTAEAVKAIPKEKVMETLAAKMNTTIPEATTALWNMHSPQNIWLIFAAVGLVSLIGMMIYNYVITKQDAKMELSGVVPGAEPAKDNATV
jgi:dipeptide/tripeptide permease